MNMEELPRVENVKVVGSSMEPTVPRGSRAVVVRTGPDGLQVGDLALIEGAQGRILHRIVFRAKIGDLALVFHRGDVVGGGIGVIEEAAVAGRALALVTASGEEWERIPDGSSWSMLISEVRCRVFCHTVRAARRFGRNRKTRGSPFSRLVRNLILGTSIESVRP